jgi:hypothetical protein
VQTKGEAHLALSEDFLDQTARVLLANNEREERKLEKELRKLQNKLSGVPAAAKALGNTASPRNRSGQEARYVGGYKGEDFKSTEGAVGKIQSAS